MGCMGSKLTPLVKYQINVETSGGMFGAGTNSCVYINMLSEDSKVNTGWIRLDNLFRNDFEKGRTDHFYIRAVDVGVPVIIQLELRDRGKLDNWACSSVTVKYMDGPEGYFPVYDWITEKISVTQGEAFTYTSVTNPAIKNFRSQELDLAKGRFEWIPRPVDTDVGWGLPRYVNETSLTSLPDIFNPSEIRAGLLAKKGLEALVNTALETADSFLFGLEDLDSYRKLYANLQKDDKDPDCINRWTTDEEFGRQQMNGITPLSFERCKRIPDCCQISNETVEDLLPEGCTLDAEMAKGKVYIGDYSQAFENVKKNKNSKGEELFCPNSICIYYVNEKSDLVPIAIQLVPNDEETIFTRKDSENDWLLAKMYFRVPMSNMHEWYYHFLLTHDVMEPFAVSVFRCFPRSHPMYKLLRPHLQTVTFINSAARQALIPPGSGTNKALAIEGQDMAVHTFKTFNMDELVIPEQLKKKGLDDAELLPKFYYRDDAMQLWTIVEKFASDIIKFYYSNDGDVEADLDVQAFANDMAKEGLGWQDGDTKGMPSSIKTIDLLVRLCTSIMYTSSVQHATVNFQQYEVYKFIPNSPAAMRMPPHRKGEATMERIMSSLPDIQMSTSVITIAYVLSSYSPDDVYLGQYPMKLFCEDGIKEIEKNYKDALTEYAGRVEERNKNVEYPYTWLLPDKIPNSIAI